MFGHYYKTKYMVKYHYHSYAVSRSDAGLDIDIIPVFILLDDVEVEEDRGRQKKHSLVIEPNKWKNIALISVSEYNIGDLLSNGAEISLSSYLYNDETDARIQMAFVCSKYMVDPEDIQYVSGGKLSITAYKSLVSSFYEDFPEKYI